MNRRVLTILLFAFIIASACAFMVYRLMSKNMVAPKQAATTGVVAAAGDIKLGTVLVAANLRTIQIAGTLPKGAILKPENALGRGVVSDLYEGEPIIENRLAAPGTGGGLAATIPNGFRACAVKVDDVVGVAGFVTPGMRVDVLISGVPPMTPGQTIVPVTVSRTILQNIQVLSAGTDYQKDAEGKAKPVQVVNLLVTPEQAQTLSLASSQAKIQLVLRNPLDTKIDKIAGTATNNLFAGDNGTPVPASLPVRAPRKTGPRPVTKGYSIEIINGSTRSQEKVASPEDKK
jgi:pilus assembly protein CpaB